MRRVIDISDVFYNKVEEMMLSENSKQGWCYGEEPTEEEWKERVIDVCVDVSNYMQWNGSIESAYFDLMH